MVFNMVATLLGSSQSAGDQPTVRTPARLNPDGDDGRVVCASIEAEVGPSARTQKGALLERWLAQCGVRAPLYSIALIGHEATAASLHTSRHRSTPIVLRVRDNHRVTSNRTTAH